MERPQRPHLQGFNAVFHVINGTCRRRELKDVAYRPRIVRLVDITLQKLKPGLVPEMGDVAQVSCKKIVQTGHVVPFTEKCVAKVRTNKAGAACDQYPQVSSFRLRNVLRLPTLLFAISALLAIISAQDQQSMVRAAPSPPC